jgi:hypothetical protein
VGVDFGKIFTHLRFRNRLSPNKHKQHPASCPVYLLRRLQNVVQHGVCLQSLLPWDHQERLQHGKIRSHDFKYLPLLSWCPKPLSSSSMYLSTGILLPLRDCPEILFAITCHGLRRGSTQVCCFLRLVL